jgi:succinylglutamate desuccinylase
MLTVLEHLPDGFLTARGPELADLLGGPALVHLPGERAQPLFVSILLHGNEITGLQAVQQLLSRYRGKALPRAMTLFIGNVEAARYGLRRLPEQADFNRIWPDEAGRLHAPPSVETRMAGQVLEIMAKRRPFAAVDVHNNTGHNPHYAAINRLEGRWLQLARAFAPAALYFRYPPGTLAMGFGALCPAVTLECGIVGAGSGAAHAAAYLDNCLRMTTIADETPPDEALRLYRTVACVTVPDDVSVTVGDAAPGQLHLRNDLESLNWQTLPAGTALGRVSGVAAMPLEVRDVNEQCCTAQYLRLDGDQLRLRQSTTPAMLSTQIRVVRQDCLCYLLERVGRPHGAHDG